MFELYLVDCETTGLNAIKNDVIEFSIYRLSDDTQKTWHLKPFNIDEISPDAMRINKHSIDDVKHLTKEGREKYLNPTKTIVEIENWLMEDFMDSNSRLLVGQNVSFDKEMLIQLWNKCNSFGTFPFNKKYGLDTMQIELFLDISQGKFAQGYNLNSLTKKYGVKNEKAHSATEDVKATVGVFKKQIEYFNWALNKAEKNLDDGLSAKELFTMLKS